MDQRAGDEANKRYEHEESLGTVELVKVDLRGEDAQHPTAQAHEEPAHHYASAPTGTSEVVQHPTVPTTRQPTCQPIEEPPQQGRPHPPACAQPADDEIEDKCKRKPSRSIGHQI